MQKLCPDASIHFCHHLHCLFMFPSSSSLIRLRQLSSSMSVRFCPAIVDPGGQNLGLFVLFVVFTAVHSSSPSLWFVVVISRTHYGQCR